MFISPWKNFRRINKLGFLFLTSILIAVAPVFALDTESSSSFNQYLSNVTGNYSLDYHTFYKISGDYLFLHDVTVSLDSSSTAKLDWLGLCACGGGFSLANPAAALTSSQCNCVSSTSPSQTWSYGGYKMTNESLVAFVQYKPFPSFATATQNPTVISKMFTEYVDGVNDTHLDGVITNFKFCGDGNLDSGEQCDDGNQISGDGCSATCTNEPVDGVCGTANLGTFVSAAAVNAAGLCAAGTPNPAAVSGSGPWAWSCDGKNGGSNGGCSASSVPPPALGCNAANQCVAGGTLGACVTDGDCGSSSSSSSSSSGSSSSSSSSSGSSSSGSSSSGSSSGSSSSGSSSSGSSSGSSSSGSSSSGSSSGSSSSGSSSSGSSSGSSSSGSSSSGSSSSGSSSSSSSSGGGGDPCEFSLSCNDASIDCDLPTLPVESGEVKVPLTTSDPGACFDVNEVCVQVASTPIVANHSQDIRPSVFSSCLPTNSFDIVSSNLYIPAQNKSVYKVQAGTYIHDKIYYCCPGAIDPVTGACNDSSCWNYDPNPSSATGSFGETCYLDTRVQPISGTGVNCSQALASVADNENICDSSYPEARTFMNPRIAQILQPFHEPGECFPVTCADGSVVDLCGCDATGNGVVISSLDVLGSSIQYLDKSNSSADPVSGEMKWLGDCASGNVIFFDPPSGGSVTLDAPGDDFVLPPYPVTLVVRGADLRIADNLIYPSDSEASLGVILLKNDVCGASFGGDAFLHPKPTNVVGAYYLEGSVKSTDQGWNLPDNGGAPSRENTAWYQAFKNQILWEGTILSLNSIGGAVDPTWPNDGQNCPVSRRPYVIGGGFPDPPWDEAVEYDLAYLREYFQCGNLASALSDYDGTGSWKISSCDDGANPFTEIAYDDPLSQEPADDTNAGEAVVIRYDSRIQNNPPPGFDNIADILHKELGL